MKKTILACAVAAASFSAPSMAEVGLNAGFVSDYYYRGGQLGDASAYAGVEYSAGGFAAGVWGINDGGIGATGDSSRGLEYDVYASYGFDVNEDFSLSAGLTQYNYTYTADYEREVNLGASFGPVALDIAVGEDVNPSGADNDYTYIALSGDISKVNVLVGNMDADLAGDAGDYTHLELSTSSDLEAIGASLSVTWGYNDPAASNSTSDQYMFLDLSKDFEL